MFKLTTAERDRAKFMILDGGASSAAARELVFRLAVGLVHQRRNKPTTGYQTTLAAILCDLLRAAEFGHWSWRPFRPAAFTGQRIGYRPFTTAIGDMVRNEMVEIGISGQQQWDKGFAQQRFVSWSRATRLRATDWLLRLMAEVGIRPDNWRDHFELIESERSLIKDPIVLRRRNVRHKGEKYRGYSMRVDLSNPKARAEHNRIERLNRFYMRHLIEPGGFRGVRRIFNNAEAPDFDFNQGGRIYAVGGGYQTMKKADRLNLKIDGESVAEIDVKASFISILSAMRGLPLDPHDDPYDIEGLPRSLVKAVVTMTLGHDRFHVRWPSEVKRDLEEKLGADLSKAFPLKKVLPLILAKLPAMKDWEDNYVSCFDLQFVESEAMLMAVERLAYHYDVASLPVHDSLIVPVSQRELAEAVIVEAFEKLAGFRPQLTLNLSNVGEAKMGGGYSLIPSVDSGEPMPSSRRYTGYTFSLIGLADALRHPHRKIIGFLNRLAAQER